MSAPKKIGITMGDPSGVGPEVICKAVNDLDAVQRENLVVIGNIGYLRKACQLLNLEIEFGSAFSDLGENVVAVVDVETTDSDMIEAGKMSAAGGQAAYCYVVEAVKLINAGKIDALVTAPLNKGAMHLAGHEYDGHTGLLAHLTKAPQSFMLLTSDKLSTVHVTTHVSMRDATELCSKQRVFDTIEIGHQHLLEMGIKNPRIAVAGLNPHCGEGGIFGREEIENIAPAVEQAMAKGINVSGPIPGDTVFYRAVRNEFDLVISQYHDQGHAPAKLLAFDTTVNVSLGLPIKRTSVDHGTAYDIAWTGKVDHQNMHCAIAYAQRWVAVDQN